MMLGRQCAAVVIGASAGGLQPLAELCGLLPADFPAPLLVVVHIAPQVREHRILSRKHSPVIKLRQKEADDGESIEPGMIYLAPANYHLLLEEDCTLSLSIDEKVNCSRPSIDVLFESAALACGSNLVGVLLSGASRDGAAGLVKIKRAGGRVLVQSPPTAACGIMPQAGVDALGQQIDLLAEARELAFWLQENVD